jgi:hypothetical protein
MRRSGRDQDRYLQQERSYSTPPSHTVGNYNLATHHHSRRPYGDSRWQLS